MWRLAAEIFAISYFLGSIPWGLLVARCKGVDIRKHGSGNIGATNVLRVVGKPWGITVFVLDALKGFVAVRIAIALTLQSPVARGYVEFFAILAAAACVVGHSFPVWLRFKGGKGVATSAGALFGIVPIAAVSIFCVWLIVFEITRYVSLASILAALALPIAVGVLVWLHLTHGFVLLYFCSAMTALVVWRHRSNISRLLSGREERFVKK
ncbi:MAG: glycerol-3-phosphate 1-O-acyltransferase PlsY [Chthoniobacterales bacterium]